MLRSMWGKTLRDERGGIVGYGLGLALYGLLIVTMFPTVAQIPGFAEMLDSYPPALKAFIGEFQMMTSIEGFLAVEAMTWVPLVLSIFAIMSATDFVAGEAERGILDLILSQPVLRWRLVIERMSALVISLVAIALVVALGMWVGLPIAGLEFPPARLVFASLATVPLVLVIAAYSLFLGCLLLSRKRAGMVAAGLTVALYLINTLATIVEQLQPWSRISPFHYFDAYDALVNGPDLVNTSILMSAAILFTVASIVVFQRRDIVAS